MCWGANFEIAASDRYDASRSVSCEPPGRWRGVYKYEPGVKWEEVRAWVDVV